jgi:EmrB/QacA subfamily drug resistance transporter
MGRVGDRYGQKLLFIGGVAVFTLFSLACALAPDIYWLIAFRTGQAVGAAAMVPISLAIMLGVFPPRRHGLATALWGSLGSVAAAVGPSIGGFLVEYGSWHWIFYVNVPVGVLAIAAALLVVPEHRRAAQARGVDLPGVVLSALGLFSLTLALIQGNDWGWTSGPVLLLFVLAAAALGLFLFWESRAASPMLNLRLFRIRSFSASNTGIGLVGVSMGGAIFLLVIFMVNILGYTELEAAASVTPMPLTALVLAPVVGRLVDKVGPRLLCSLGTLFFATGLFLLGLLDASATAGDVVWRVMIIGAGIAFTMPTFMAAGMASLPHEVGGVGAGALNTARQFGFVLGIAVLVAIFTHTVADASREAVAEATTYVQSQDELSAQAKEGISAGLRRQAAERAESGPAGGQGPELNLPPAAAGSPQAQSQEALRDHLAAIFKTNLAAAFRWPFWAAALFSLAAFVPATLTGNRLGQFAGRHARP